MKRIIPLFLAAGLAILSGCSTPARTLYSAVSTAQVTVEQAMAAWDDCVKEFAPGRAAELAVKTAYEKYQEAAAAVVDAEQAIAAATASNSTNNTASLNQAQLDASNKEAQALSDLVALIRSYGAKL